MPFLQMAQPLSMGPSRLPAKVAFQMDREGTREEDTREDREGAPLMQWEFKERAHWVKQQLITRPALMEMAEVVGKAVAAAEVAAATRPPVTMALLAAAPEARGAEPRGQVI